MSRTFVLAALISLSAVSAQAATLAERVHDAAVQACAVEASSSLPAAHYAAITKTCVDRLSAGAIHKMSLEADAKTHASTAVLITNQ